MRQVKHGIASHRSYLETLRSRFHLDAQCLPRCLHGLSHVIEARELLLEQLSQTYFSNQEMHARWEEQWTRESARLEHEIAQVPHAYQAGIQLGQSQQVRFILTGINKPVPQTHLQSHYTLRVLERQLDLSSQHARRFLTLRRETWTLFIQRTEIESHMTVLTALLEQWYQLQGTLEQPASVDLASLCALILSSFTI
ncbi:hypothetical protein [Ktedonospora formicarum]|uniref:Uncharacterized protein n=1 Tax=Ktedonospora formicarum TaxID=2778364 RepID=A0A8J3I6T7_9CHLR|nr:hypothetical protein [Ktedonospora formicarum]GHO49716.1 hypothetical protein KSX_78790 [Ktedonospora formicarum]